MKLLLRVSNSTRIAASDNLPEAQHHSRYKTRELHSGVRSEDKEERVLCEKGRVDGSIDLRSDDEAAIEHSLHPFLNVVTIKDNCCPDSSKFLI